MTRRLLSASLLILLVVLLCGSTVLAGGWQYSAVGARAKGLAGAYRALSDDWSGIYYNPAGLAYLNSNSWNVTAETSTPRPEVQTNFQLNGYDLGYLDGQTRYPHDQTMLWGSSSIVVRPDVAGPFAFGGAVYQSFDHNSDMNLFYLRQAYSSEGTMPERNHLSNFDVIAFHPAIAMKFSEDRIAVGLGLPIYRGDMFIDQVRLVQNPYGYVLDVRPYEYFPKLYQIDGFGYGVGFNFGVQFRPNEKVSLGASYTSSAKIKIDGTSSEEVFLPYNRGIVNLYNDPSAKQDSLQTEIFTAFSGGTFTSTSDFEADLKLPSEFGFGIAYQANEKWLLAADIVFTRWSEFEDLDIKISNRLMERTVYPTWREMFSDLYIPIQWDDKMKVSLGAEGVLNNRWTVRGGYMFDQSPIPDETFSELFMDTGTKHHLTLGARMELSETIYFEGAVEGVFYAERTFNTAVDVNGDGYFDNLPGTYKNLTLSSTWAFNYRF
ncbi:MAG: outer membrane protein transport protein [bacterium]